MTQRPITGRSACQVTWTSTLHVCADQIVGVDLPAVHTNSCVSGSTSIVLTPSSAGNAVRPGDIASIILGLAGAAGHDVVSQAEGLLP